MSSPTLTLSINRPNVENIASGKRKGLVPHKPLRAADYIPLFYGLSQRNSPRKTHPVIINSKNLDLVFRGFQTVYSDAYLEAPVDYDKIAMTVKSQSRDETYGWLGQFPQLREWIGPRHIRSLTAHAFTIQNRSFESTVSVPREDIADDRLGVFKPAFSEMGQLARRHPEELVFDLLSSGFETECFDGQNFFDTDHPVMISEGETDAVSNMQAGSSEPWYLLDTSRSVRPIVWQEREPYEFVSKVNPSDDNVFFNKEYIYGVSARVNAGFGLWQLAFGSQLTLNADNYSSARAAMMSFKGEGGRKLGIKPTTLVVPPSLEKAALELLNTDTFDGGGSNPWKGTVELIVTPYVAE